MLDKVAWVQPLKRQRRRLIKRMKPLQYKEGYVNMALDADGSGTYLEIGVRSGDSMVDIRARRRIGVDPAPQVPPGFLRPDDTILEMTSDDYFEAIDAGRIAAPLIDVAVVDGLHEFRQALRDTLNVARFMKPDGVIVVDDCNPRTQRLASDQPTGSSWNGDVWKVMAIIRATQPQWRVVTVAADQGVGLIWGFDRPASPIGDSAVDDFKRLEFDHLSRDRAGVIGLTPHDFLPPDFPPGVRR